MSIKTQRDILRAVRESGSYSISDLATRFEVSTETIRRNIKPLIDNGSIVKFHGGVMSPRELDEPPFRRRMQVNRDAKRLVADLVADLVEDGDSLILDNGTTTAYVAEALTRRSKLVVVTNSLEIAYRMAGRNGNRVFMAGGELGEDGAVFGSTAVDFVRQFKVKRALISVGGINNRGDIVDFNLFESEFTKVAMEQAQETWIITDRSKFGREAPVRVGDLSSVNMVVTDVEPERDFVQRCLDFGVRIVTPGAEASVAGEGRKRG